VALKKPFGALNNAYYGPTMGENDQLFFPKDIPKGQASRATRTIYPSPRTSGPIDDLWIGFGNGAAVEIFNWLPVSLCDAGRGLAIVGAR
jgi:hypothetical protein